MSFEDKTYIQSHENHLLLHKAQADCKKTNDNIYISLLFILSMIITIVEYTRFKIKNAGNFPDPKSLELSVDFYERGLEKMKSNDLRSAATEFRHSIKHNKKHLKAHVNLASIYYSQGRFTESERIYKKVLEIDEFNYDAHLRLASIYVDQRKLKEAEHFYHSAVEIRSKSVEPYVALGLLHAKKNHTDLALQNFRKALKLSKEGDTQYYLINGYMNRLKLDTKAEFESFNKAFSLNSTSSEGLYNLGVFFLKKNKTEKAVQYFLDSIGSNPEHKEAYLKLAYSYTILRSYPEAFDVYMNLLNKFPDLVDGHYLLGLLYKKTHYYKEAIICLKRCLEINKNFINALGALGKIMRDSNQIDMATKYFTDILKINPNHVETLKNLKQLKAS